MESPDSNTEQQMGRSCSAHEDGDAWTGAVGPGPRRPLWDVIVIGGGPAGLACAIATRREGMRVLVTERAPSTIDKVCGEGLMPDGVAALAALGVTIPADDSMPFQGIRFIGEDYSAIGSFPRVRGFGIRRTTLHRTLADHARQAGVTIAWGTRATGLIPEGVLLNGRTVSCRWVIGADGQNSLIRKWAGLDDIRHERIRFGHRRHFSVKPWTDFVEVYWGGNFQIVVTPVETRLICVALVSANPRLRLDDALASLPVLSRRLAGAEAKTRERGAVSVLREIRSVHRGHVALVGDASGSVESLTGQGLCLAFRQAAFLARAVANEDLSQYAAAHWKIAFLPTLMSRLLLYMSDHDTIRSGALHLLARRPQIFSLLIKTHLRPGLPAPLLTGRSVEAG